MQPRFALRARGTVDVEETLQVLEQANDRFMAFVQVADADRCYDEAHALTALAHAVRAHEREAMASKTLGAEFLRYYTATRQAGRAIAAGGVREGQQAALVVAAGPQAGAAVWWFLDQLGWTRDPAGLAANDEAAVALGIEDSQRGTASMSDLVLERVALLDLER